MPDMSDTLKTDLGAMREHIGHLLGALLQRGASCEAIGDCLRAAITTATDGMALAEAERTRCEIWTRVMGYHRPVSAFHPGKQSEHRDRVYFHAPAGYSGDGDIARDDGGDHA